MPWPCLPEDACDQLSGFRAVFLHAWPMMHPTHGADFGADYLHAWPMIHIAQNSTWPQGLSITFVSESKHTQQLLASVDPILLLLSSHQPPATLLPP
jgi:hypothetical protein